MCFYNLTNSYFSILPNEFEKNLKDEIWGCFKYIGIPMDTIMNMPIQDRKYYIMKHNADEAELNPEALPSEIEAENTPDTNDEI